ncbi:hypothetical protein SAY86_000567 [Trapa natans]|uniref:Uncharacterized protein n=1 Tax=Trapa natans TaxID=22666 RepID=A0AAN7MC59_TRANT|nr:hypothetical protein SAY86_000567 [Trapa natans]
MESTIKRQSSEKSTSRLNPSAEPFTLERRNASQSKTQSFMETVRQKENDPSASTANQSSGNDGDNSCQGSKSLDGSLNSLSGKSTGISKEAVQVRSQPIDHIAVKVSPLVKSMEQINSLGSLRSIKLPSFSMMKPRDSDGAAATDSSLVPFDKDDLNSKEPDEDSPCWRGTNSLSKSPFTPDACTNTKFPENRSEVTATLNPLAPQYIPQSYERRLNLNGCGSSNTDEIQELNGELSTEDEAGKLCLHSHEAVPSLPEETLASNGKMVAGGVLQVPMNDFEDVSVDRAPLRIDEYISLCSSLDAKLVIDVMHEFSMILVKKCSENQSLGEPQLTKIEGIIQNLSLCKGPERSCNPPNNSSDALELEAPTETDFCYQIPNMDIHPNGSTAVITQPVVDDLGYCSLLKPDSALVANKMLDPCTFIGNIGAEIAQADSNASGDVHEMDQQVPLQALVYKNLWLHTMEELHSMKLMWPRIAKPGVGKLSG